MFKKHVYPVNKTDYILERRGKKADDCCILCAVRDKDPAVVSLEVYRESGFIVSLNLYPYNPGHLMIFPERHFEDIREMTNDEQSAFHSVCRSVMDIIDREYKPQGYNIGFNIGKGSGASIPHLHCHIVPRYEGELGFIDIIGGSKVYIEDPKETFSRLKKAFSALKK